MEIGTIRGSATAGDAPLIEFNDVSATLIHVKPPGGYRRRPTRKVQNQDPATLLHRYAVSLFDKGDGRAIDWPRAAIALFTAGLACADEALADPNTQTVLRRVHDAAYTRMTGSSDSGMPFASSAIEKPSLTPDAGLDPAADCRP